MDWTTCPASWLPVRGCRKTSCWGQCCLLCACCTDSNLSQAFWIEAIRHHSMSEVEQVGLEFANFNLARNSLIQVGQEDTYLDLKVLNLLGLITDSSSFTCFLASWSTPVCFHYANTGVAYTWPHLGREITLKCINQGCISWQGEQLLDSWNSLLNMIGPIVPIEYILLESWALSCISMDRNWTILATCSQRSCAAASSLNTSARPFIHLQVLESLTCNNR